MPQLVWELGERILRAEGGEAETAGTKAQGQAVT